MIITISREAWYDHINTKQTFKIIIKIRVITRGNDKHFIIMKWPIHPEDITFLNL